MSFSFFASREESSFDLKGKTKENLKDNSKENFGNKT
jgi:hypothetical protein